MTKELSAISVLALTIVALLALTGCSTFSQKECNEMDWRESGQKSALAGQKAAEGFAYYGKECGTTHGINPNKENFTEGYAQGLTEFCKPESAKRFGQKGGRYQDICPKHLEQQFLRDYQTGKLDYVSTKLQSLEQEVQTLRRQNADKDQKIRDLESQLNSKK